MASNGLTEESNINDCQQATGASTKPSYEAFLDKFFHLFVLKLKKGIEHSNVLFSKTFEKEFYEYNFYVIFLNEFILFKMFLLMI